MPIPFDPRDRLAPPETDDSVAQARYAAEVEHREHVLRVGRHSPRNGLIAILVRHPDASAVLNELFALHEAGHSFGQLRLAFNRLLAERWGR